MALNYRETPIPVGVVITNLRFSYRWQMLEKDKEYFVLTYDTKWLLLLDENYQFVGRVKWADVKIVSRKKLPSESSSRTK